MKKLTKNRLIAGMVLSAAFVAAIGVANHAIYTADAADAETGIAGNFAMTDGMSIRKENPVGLRFLASVDSAFRASLEKKYSPEEYVYEFGTVLTVGEKQTIAPIKQWKDEAKTEYTMVIYEIPETDYATEISAKGYVTVYAQADIDKETAIYTQYTSNEVSRSAAYVASVALNNGESGDALINYLKPVAKGITLSESKVTLSALNETKTLAATTNPVDYKAVWSSSNDGIVSVDKNGVITAKDYGKATITAKFGDYTATCEVSVPITADPLGFVASGATLSKVEKDGEQVIKVVSESGTSVGFKNVIENGIKGKFFDCGYTYVSFDMYVESCGTIQFYTSALNIWTNPNAGYEWKDNNGNDYGKQGDYLRSYSRYGQGLIRKPLSKGAWYNVSMWVQDWSTQATINADGGATATYYLKNLHFNTAHPEEKAPDSVCGIVTKASTVTLQEVTEGESNFVRISAAGYGDYSDWGNLITFAGLYSVNGESELSKGNYTKLCFDIYFEQASGVRFNGNGNFWWYPSGTHDPDPSFDSWVAVKNSDNESVTKVTTGQWYSVEMTPSDAFNTWIGIGDGGVLRIRNVHFA